MLVDVLHFVDGPSSLLVSPIGEEQDGRPLGYLLLVVLQLDIPLQILVSLFSVPHYLTYASSVPKVLSLFLDINADRKVIEGLLVVA